MTDHRQCRVGERAIAALAAGPHELGRLRQDRRRPLAGLYVAPMGLRATRPSGRGGVMMEIRRHVPTSLLVTAVAIVLAACGTAGSSGNGAGSTAASGLGSTPAAARTGPVTGHVGDKLTFSGSAGDSADATLVKVFDPATPANTSTAPLPAGARWVGIELLIDNHSPQAGGDSWVVDGKASNGSALTTDDVYQGFSRPIGAFTGCTESTSMSDPDVPYTQCEAFVVPDGQTLVQVGYEINQFGPTDQATWTVP